jgi:hypothetical protein
MTPATSSTRFSEFFGRVPLLLSERKRFAAVQESLRELCRALEAGIIPPPAGLDPVLLVNELGLVLADHFEAAERSLERVATHRPDLLPAVVDLRTDHTMLAGSMADLRLLAADRERWTELPRRIASLLAVLAAHREAEATLVSRGTAAGS